MSFYVHLTRDDPEDDIVTVATLGPFGYAYIDRDGISADSGVVAEHDGVNPGYWIWPNGERTLVEADGFRIESAVEAPCKAERGWRIVTSQREVIVHMRSRDHAIWRVATDKREGEVILRAEPVEPGTRP